MARSRGGDDDLDRWLGVEEDEPGAATARVCLRQGRFYPRKEHIQGHRDMVTLRNHLPLPLALESPFESAASSLNLLFACFCPACS